jgi:hypothetical protein
MGINGGENICLKKTKNGERKKSGKRKNGRKKNGRFKLKPKFNNFF